MAWYRWSRSGRVRSWHIASFDEAGPVTLCGLSVPLPEGDVVITTLLNSEPPENEKTCETCLRVSHRDVAGDL